ncbi:MAG: ABC transporter ATP-binding protein [Candidatus Hodarchaeales archaeon]
MLEVNNLSVKYPASTGWAISDISFKASAGQITLVTGASGSGKSTLAGAIMTIIPNFISAKVKGEILGKGAQINHLSRSEFINLCGYVPQYPADFVTTLSVEEEIRSILENIGKLPDEIHERVDEVFSLLKIDHIRQKVQTEISSGELQRVSLAVAIAPNPPILILDEPMARIDLESEKMLVNLISTLSRQGMSILIFEHRLDYLLERADKVILLKNGKIATSGPPEEVVLHLGDVDIPEVSLIDIPGNKTPSLSISRLVDSIRSFISREEMES